MFRMHQRREFDSARSYLRFSLPQFAYDDRPITHLLLPQVVARSRLKRVFTAAVSVEKSYSFPKLMFRGCHFN